MQSFLSNNQTNFSQSEEFEVSQIIKIDICMICETIILIMCVVINHFL